MTTDWEALYQAGETQWDKGAPAPALVEFLAQAPLQGRVLVPGCGRGHDVRAIAAAGADDVIGLDLAPSAFAGVETFPNTHFVVGDLFALPSEYHGAFDAVYEHTCYCAIPRERRDDYVQAVAGALKPGGLLLGIFYLNPRDDPDPSLGPPFNATLDELDTRFAEHFTLLRSETPTVAFPGREGREVLRLLQRRGDSHRHGL
ncbi:methyltransferase domain-containing protein [Armatimonas rosea]|uniref:SAM-dependent methyltransferase n=1 Tax=Armatimonas rosea TaxID=685828 RepID=A0A7W9SVY4_ARMRO|nr:methyltransferase domain-containing protein [Armatimonas rosea]MBB6052919.1 SAM-dependent methyltransferase [Armatimonas rosea]